MTKKISSAMRIRNIGEYYKLLGLELLHPLAGIIDRSKINKMRREAIFLSFEFYAVSYKEDQHCHLKYGRNYFDYQAGTLVFFGPDQLIDVDNVESEESSAGYNLVFHPDIFTGTPLAKQIKDYTFFNYGVHEALHLSATEKQLIVESLNSINRELSHPVDIHSKRLLSAGIDLLLSYCLRFYDRQFITRDRVNHNIVHRFETLAKDYNDLTKGITNGLPSVSYFAEQLKLSPNYFSDLIKRETGKSALEHIQDKMFQSAKEKISDPRKSIGTIAYELGFAYPQHFTRFFKQHSGYSPNEYRKIN
jgi:AraC-like DNA-binding protein